MREREIYHMQTTLRKLIQEWLANINMKHKFTIFLSRVIPQTSTQNKPKF